MSNLNAHLELNRRLTIANAITSYIVLMEKKGDRLIDSLDTGVQTHTRNMLTALIPSQDLRVGYGLNGDIEQDLLDVWDEERVDGTLANFKDSLASYISWCVSEMMSR